MTVLFVMVAFGFNTKLTNGTVIHSIETYLLRFSRPFSIFQCPVKQKRDLLRSNPPGIAGLVRMDGEGYACKVRVFSVSVLRYGFYPFS
jgi:hypothetical protein